MTKVISIKRKLLEKKLLKNKMTGYERMLNDLPIIAKESDSKIRETLKKIGFIK